MNNFEDITDFLEYLGDAVLIINESSEIIFANAACLSLFGYVEQGMQGMSVGQLMAAEMANHGDLARRFIHSGSKSRAMMSRNIMNCQNASGESFSARISIASVSILGERVGIATIQDFSLYQAELEQLAATSYQDSLTGLYNRRYLKKIVEPDSRLLQKWSGLGVVYIDLNKFKPINDRYGHDVGDTVLKVVANRLRESVRFDDIVFRIGGDEFLILLDLSSVENKPESATHIVENIYASVTKPVVTQNVKIKIGLSAGCAIYPDQGCDLDKLISLADKAMYKAKESGSIMQLAEVN